MSENEQIKALNARDHIRFRPGMYIGSVDKLGMHNLMIGVLRFLCEQNNTNTELVLDLSNDSTVLKLKGTVLNEMFSADAEKMLEALTGFGMNLFDSSDAYYITVLIHLASDIKVSTDKEDLFVLNEGKFDFIPTNKEKVDWLNFHFILDDEFFGNHTFSKGILSNECEKLAALNSNVQIELVDRRNGCNYQERFTMEGGLIQLFNNKLDRLNADGYESYQRNFVSPIFHSRITEPALSLELVFNISNQKDTFENSYYRFVNLTNGGSHISYLKMRLEQLNKKLNGKFDAYDNDLNYYNLITNVETEQPFPFAGPTKTRIEDPMLVQIMKATFDKLEPEIISFYSSKNA